MTLVSSGALDGPLTFKQKALLKFHFTICGACRNYRAHMTALKAGAIQLFKSQDTDITRALKKRVMDELTKKRK